MGNEFQAYGASWYDSAWDYRRKIAIAGDLASSTLTNFPLLVQITNANDAVFSHAQANGNDILFTAENGTELLDFEIEFYTNAPTPRLTAWVRIPVLSNGSSTVLRMYYGNSNATSVANAGGVWDEHFKMVQHLEEDGTGTRYDSTTNGYHSTAVVNFDGDESVYGLIGRAHDFGGTDECLTFNHPIVQGLTNVTWEAWFEDKPAADGRGGVVGSYAASIYDDSTENRLYLTVRTVNEGVRGHQPSTYNDPWIHVALVYDGAQVRYYVKGRLMNTVSATGGLYSDAYYWQIGAVLNGQFFKGMIDEVRISSTSRSAAWIRASYDNQYTPDLHTTIGLEHGRFSSDRWHHYQTVMVSSNLADSVLTNFPLFVQITNAANAVFTQALPDGSDIYFTLSGSETRLDHEIEYYAAGATPRFDAWVRIPLLAADADTELRLVYGNPSAAAQQNAGGVWDEHFKMVQHLNETGSGVRYDSTLNNVDSAAHSLTGDEVFVGPLGRALLLDGTTSDIITVDNNVLSIPTNITIEAWMQPNILVQGDVLGQYYSGNKLARHVEGRHWYSFRVNGTALSYTKADTDPAFWASLAITYDGSQFRCFSNGSVVYTEAVSGARDYYTRPWQIGGSGSSTVPFLGHLDEIRISDIARSEAWMRASYNSQYAPADYLAFGKQKNLTPIGTLISIR
ncbi:MAG: DUF2341 domain-containing protein [Kiritimatiellia bacterium]